MPTDIETDGTVVTYDTEGHVTRQVMPDGTVFDAFNADSKPTHGIIAGQGGEPPQTVDITYAGDTSTWSYADGTVVTRAGDAVTRQQLSDGTVYDAFNAEGKPTHGTVPGTDGAPPQTVSIAYTGGNSVWTYTGQDGQTTVVSRDPNGAVLTTASGGWTFGQFDSEGRPLSGTAPGEGGAGPQTVSIDYTEGGGSVWTYTDQGEQTVITKNSDGAVTQMTSGGWTFDKFDGEGRPLTGSKPGADGQADQTVAVSYTAEGSVWTYSDGTEVTKDADGDVTLIKDDGWTYDKFDEQGRPLEGTKDGQTVEITYLPNGITETRYGDGTVVGTTPSGTPVYEIADGQVVQFSVEIPKLGEATKKVGTHFENITTGVVGIVSQFSAISGEWISPAGFDFMNLLPRLSTAMTNALDVLGDSYMAMAVSYDSYVAVEEANYKNMTPSQSTIDSALLQQQEYQQSKG